MKKVLKVLVNKWVALIIVIAGIGFVAYPFVRNYYREQKAMQMIDSFEFGNATIMVDVQQVKAGDQDSWIEADGLDNLQMEDSGDDFSALELSGEITDVQIEIGEDDVAAEPSNDEPAPGEMALDATAQAELTSDLDTIKRKKLDIIGKLEIPRIDSVQPIVENAGKTELNYAVGHVGNTADFGRIGNCVLAGHRNYTYGSMFNRLDEMQPGDEIIVTMRDGTKAIYVVYETLDVLPGVPEISRYHKDERRLTLATCTPIGVGSHRLLVRAHLQELVESTQELEW